MSGNKSSRDKDTRRDISHEEPNDDFVLEGSILADAVSRILTYFLEPQIAPKFTKTIKHFLLDIRLRKEQNSYSIQVTNRGPTNIDIQNLLRFTFDDIISAGLISGNLIVADVFSRGGAGQQEIIHEAKLAQKTILIHDNVSVKKVPKFPYLKEYLAIKLKCKLLSTDLTTFKESLIQEIVLLQTTHTNVKFMFYLDDEILYNNYIKLDDDYKNCKLLSSALVAVIQQSVNTTFRDNCLRLLQVANSYSAQEAIMSRILPMIHGNYTFVEESSPITENENTPGTSSEYRRKQC
ncbi:uncharacterized protein LOC105699965 [Orussus abietinus]|uniref:uncharacterized protein LOC105699965 n=1 Tax=Orussus abietinus TaxID=222816 RepID=UPI000C715EED|nr:uncharacterized protein LOC105699965 [Orussus abietinus]